jgi:hypothetical protein
LPVLFPVSVGCRFFFRFPSVAGSFSGFPSVAGSFSGFPAVAGSFSGFPAVAGSFSGFPAVAGSFSGFRRFSLLFSISVGPFPFYGFRRLPVSLVLPGAPPGP